MSDAFSDQTTIVGTIGAAQVGTAAGAANADLGRSPRTSHKAATPFSMTLARASLPQAATLPATTAAKAAAAYAANARSRASA